MKLSELRAIVDQYVESHERELLHECARLIDIHSETGMEYDVQVEVRRMMEEMDLSVDFWEPDDAELRASKLFSETGESFVHRPVCVGVRAGRGVGRSLLINGHVDTVSESPIEKWVSDPFTADVRDGKLYGRGASDMKSGLAMAMFALRAIGDLKILLDGDVIIASVPAEENGGNGTVAALLRGYNRADAALYPEPTSNAIQPAHRGAAFWRVHIDGKASHGGTKYKGVSAVEKGIKVAEKLRELEQWRHENICSKHPLYADYPLSAPVTLGIFRGGQFTSGVPENCLLEGCIEYVPGEKSEDVRRMLEGAVASACEGDAWMQKHPPRVEWFGLLYEPAETAADHPFVRLAADSFQRVLGRAPTVNGFEAGTDMRLMSNAYGTPGFMFGPGDIATAHAPNEFVSIAQLKEATKVVMLLMLRWCKNDVEEDVQ